MWHDIRRKTKVVPLYKADECKNYRWIHLLHILGIVFGRLLTERIQKESVSKIQEVQNDIRLGRE